MTSTLREFDLILMGATGFTGRLVAEYLLPKEEEEGLTWAIAGRNQAKLERLKADLGPRAENLSIVLADSFDKDSLIAMARRSRVISSTVGPYSKYGSLLVEACVEEGTDYCDLTGEAHWVRKLIDTYHHQARNSGARIVHFCGFDSIPSDLGTLMLQHEAIARHNRPANSVHYYLTGGKGGVSGGTLESMAVSLEQASTDATIQQTLSDPYGLNPQDQRHGPDGNIQMSMRYDDAVNAWTAPFVMAVINEKVVRRSNALLDYAYGPTFRYAESSLMGSGLTGALRAGGLTTGLGLFAGGMALTPTRRLLQRFVLPAPGEGPSDTTRNAGYFRVLLRGEGLDDSGTPFVINAHVGADQDPGYGATSMMLAEAAISLALDGHQTEHQGGILTPASALGAPLIDRLRQAGMTFDIDPA